MAGKELENRIFVGGLAWDVSERQLEDAFSRFGKIIDSQMPLDGISEEVLVQLDCIELLKLYIICVLKLCQLVVWRFSSLEIMVERDTGRPRGFGFLTFADRRGMEDAIREMHGRELGDRAISVNKAQPRMGGEDLDHGYGGGYSSGGRGSYGGGDRSVGQDDCFKCGHPGHWARDCPSAGGGRGGGQFSSHSRLGGLGGRGDRFGGDRGRYIDDRYDGGRYGDRDHYESRDRYGSRDRHVDDRYPLSERFAGDRYGASDRYPQNGYGKDRSYDNRDGGPRGSGDRYGGGGPSRHEGRSYRDRSGPYDRPRRGGRPSFDRY
ncbi:glycine-rich RNA-binding protein RZ1C-like isoform X1 [Camellia sinensis]|uniref:glycine-rich RNA-binding protein RZ1C-like isoform X1 n=1 Tax=Camellia sinensis TaxID=4442 RepID=UPI001036D40D|nr:glycine-rich RNA-binding protein RZ1C-like isoform X1 [Camellia sinensis]